MSQNFLCDVPTALAELRAGRVLALTGDGGTYLTAATDGLTLGTFRSLVSVSGGIANYAVLETDLRGVTLPETLAREYTLGAECGRNDAECNNLAHRDPVIPVSVRKLGVLGRPGPAECILDLTKSAGLSGSGFFSTVMQVEGKPWEIANRDDLKVFQIATLIEHRLRNENHIEPRLLGQVQTRYGAFQAVQFDSDVFDSCLVLIKGNAAQFHERPPLVRIESVEVGTLCSVVVNLLNASMDGALKLMYRDGLGILICMPSLNRLTAEGFTRQLTMRFFEDDPFATLDGEEFNQVMTTGICAQILGKLGAERIRAVSSRPRRLAKLEKFGVKIVSSESTAEDWVEPSLQASL